MMSFLAPADGHGADGWIDGEERKQALFELVICFWHKRPSDVIFLAQKVQRAVKKFSQLAFLQLPFSLCVPHKPGRKKRELKCEFHDQVTKKASERAIKREERSTTRCKSFFFWKLLP
jgi:hypothetical protein